jgi:hypothetical protein
MKGCAYHRFIIIRNSKTPSHMGWQRMVNDGSTVLLEPFLNLVSMTSSGEEPSVPKGYFRAI